MFFEDGVTLFSLVTQLVTLEEVCIQPNKIHRLIHCVAHGNSQLVDSQPPTPSWMAVLNTANIGRIDRCHVAMGCVLDVVWALYSIKRWGVGKIGAIAALHGGAPKNTPKTIIASV